MSLIDSSVNLCYHTSMNRIFITFLLVDVVYFKVRSQKPSTLFRGGKGVINPYYTRSPLPPNSKGPNSNSVSNQNSGPPQPNIVPPPNPNLDITGVAVDLRSVVKYRRPLQRFFDQSTSPTHKYKITDLYHAYRVPGRLIPHFPYLDSTVIEIGIAPTKCLRSDPRDTDDCPVDLRVSKL